MAEWWKNAAWMIVDGIGYIHPDTKIEIDLKNDEVKLTCAKTKLQLIIPTDSVLGKEAIKD